MHNVVGQTHAHLSLIRSGWRRRSHLAGMVTAGSAMTRYSTTATVAQNTTSDQAFIARSFYRNWPPAASRLLQGVCHYCRLMRRRAAQQPHLSSLGFWPARRYPYLELNVVSWNVSCTVNLLTVW